MAKPIFHFYHVGGGRYRDKIRDVWLYPFFSQNHHLLLKFLFYFKFNTSWKLKIYSKEVCKNCNSSTQYVMVREEEGVGVRYHDEIKKRIRFYDKRGGGGLNFDIQS